jgi:hypothetical protein
MLSSIVRCARSPTGRGVVWQRACFGSRPTESGEGCGMLSTSDPAEKAPIILRLGPKASRSRVRPSLRGLGGSHHLGRASHDGRFLTAEHVPSC